MRQLFLSSCFLFSLSPLLSCGHSPKVSFHPSAGTLPHDVQFVASFNLTLSVAESLQSAWNEVVADKALRMSAAEFKTLVSPLTEGNPKNLGFDTQRLMNIAQRNSRHGKHFLLQVPVADHEKALQTMKPVLHEIGGSSKTTQLRNQTVYHNRQMALLVQSDTMLLCVGRSPYLGLADALSMAGRKPLVGREGFRRISDAMPGARSFNAYISTELFKKTKRASRKTPFSKVPVLSDIGVSVKKHKGKTKTKLFFPLKKTSFVHKIQQHNHRDELAELIPGPAYGLIKTNAKLDNLQEVMDGLGPRGKKAFARFQKSMKQLNIDMQKDVLNTQAGPIVVAFVPTSKKRKLPFANVAYLTFSNAEFWQQKWPEMCRTSRGIPATSAVGVEYCSIGAMSFAIWKQHLIFATASYDKTHPIFDNLGQQPGLLADYSSAQRKAYQKPSMMTMTMNWKVMFREVMKSKRMFGRHGALGGALVADVWQKQLLQGYEATLISSQREQDVLTFESQLSGGLSLPGIGVLAAIAIPNFVSMQYKAKRSEVPTNLKGIKTAQLSYEAAFDTYIDAKPWPPGRPGKKTRYWPRKGSGFETIGWRPVGDVRGQYWVEVLNDGKNFRATGISDVDGDGVFATYVATKSMNPNAPETAPDIY